jgi:hypothetical protein
MDISNSTLDGREDCSAAYCGDEEGRGAAGVVAKVDGGDDEEAGEEGGFEEVD